MESTLLAIIELSLWAAVGVFIARLFLRQHITQINEQINQSKEVLDRTIICVAEHHNDQIYLFDQITDEFIAQGRDMDEVKRRLHERYKGTKNVILVNQKEDNETSVSL
jgi:uncharacterized membrane-anchored protein YhcB (DUF1043 family)